MCKACGLYAARHPFVICGLCARLRTDFRRQREFNVPPGYYAHSTPQDRAETIVQAQRLIRAHAERQQP